MERTRYRIMVRGRLTERLGSAFEGLDLEPGMEETALVGEIRDQSHLYGVLDLVRGLGLELVSVETNWVTSEPGDQESYEMNRIVPGWDDRVTCSDVAQPRMYLRVSLLDAPRPARCRAGRALHGHRRGHPLPGQLRVRGNIMLSSSGTTGHGRRYCLDPVLSRRRPSIPLGRRPTRWTGRPAAGRTPAGWRHLGQDLPTWMPSACPLVATRAWPPRSHRPAAAARPDRHDLRSTRPPQTDIHRVDLPMPG